MTPDGATIDRPAFAAVVARAAALAAAAEAVCRDHEAVCRRKAERLGRKERGAALAAHGPDNAWLWLADPDVLALRAAVTALVEEIGG